MTGSNQAFFARLRVEDPRRIREFRQRLVSLKWDPANALASLKELFDAVDQLADAEVHYYYRRRGTRAWISGFARVAAWLLGSIGLLLPLLAGTAAPQFKELGQYGYVFLAGAASCLAANALFGGTSGHVRFVSTQLELERLVTKARIDWCAFLAEAEIGAVDTKTGFAQVQLYATALHTATIAETGRWSESSLAELAKYESSVQAGRSSKSA
ncbi:SLATT domain-containing protein [Ramlibacter sp. XY19]|uniref:SLATT domain-containing protein n=1 Tax=Ramlibacter paludis TaxID=2908000 RepID=UPI0023DC4837|nr:SLATT domain-containing protein [Ramlibacter paludis]MCG2593927.1 SLATT domain-containing protein [Ramlibacter paludis]